MEALTRLVSESLARHGFDRPLDYRRLQWSRWFRCESPHSLLQVPSKPGVFALAQEIVHVGRDEFARPETDHVGADPLVRPSEQSSDVSLPESRRMLAVSQFFETDDMAFVLDRMLSRQNPMRARLASGRYFVRFVAIEDESQRRSICNALNQWIVTSTEKATGIGSHFATSLELTHQTDPEETVEGSESAARTLLSATASSTTPSAKTPDPTLSSRRAPDSATQHAGPDPACAERSRTVRPPELSEPPFIIKSTPAAPTAALQPGAATNIHRPFPAGF